MDISTAMTVSAGLALAVFGAMTMSVSSDAPEEPEPAPAAQDREISAWEFYRWLMSVTKADMEANPPAAQSKIVRGYDGMWRVFIYNGVERPFRAMMLDGHSEGRSPPVKPDYEHSYRTIGPEGGFLRKADADAFLAEYRKPTKGAFGYAADGKPVDLENDNG